MDSHQNWYRKSPLDVLQVYQISAGLEYKFVSYSDFFKCAKKTKKKTHKFAHSYLGNALRNFLWNWCVVSLGRRAPPQQLWYSSDKRSWSYECVKITTLLFLLIYSCSLHAPRMTHCRVSWFNICWTLILWKMENINAQLSLHKFLIWIVLPQ